MSMNDATMFWFCSWNQENEDLVWESFSMSMMRRFGALDEEISTDDDKIMDS